MEPGLVQRSSKRPIFDFLMSKLSNKRKPHKPKLSQNDTVIIHNPKEEEEDDVVVINTLFPPKSPLITRPKQLLTQISNKAIKLVHHHHHKNKKRVDESEWDPCEVDDEEKDEFGEGGVWQKTILMGDKCQPLDFSGVIYYDSCGKLLNEVPLRSPRATPLPSYLSRLPN